MPGPVDQLIAEVAEGKRNAATGDGDTVRAHIAQAPFNREVRKEEAWSRLGISVTGQPHPSNPQQTISSTTPLSSLEYHVAKHMLDGEWKPGTSPEAYERDCQLAAQKAYIVKAGVRIVALAATQARVNATDFPNLNFKPGQVLLVIYDTVKSRIVTGYYLPEAEAPNQVYKKWIQKPRPVVLSLTT